jgi:hypothetical protein
MNQSATCSIESSDGASASKFVFARRFVEMLLVMFIGMGMLAGLAQLAFGVSGSSLSAHSGGLRVILMGLSMTAPMVAWMAYRGHTFARNAEMAASMVIPTLIAAVLAGAGALDSATALAVQHIAMIPAMLGLMLWRYDEYAFARLGGRDEDRLPAL